MAKTVLPSIRDVVSYPSTATASALDPTLYDSPTEFRYTTWDLFGSRRNPSKGKYGPFGIFGPNSSLAKALTTIVESRIKKYAAAQPSVPDIANLASGDFLPVMPTFAQFMPGTFQYLGVPFHVSEPKSTGELLFHRNYVPSYTMRVLTELAIIWAGKPRISYFLGLHSNKTGAELAQDAFNWDIDPDAPGAYCSSGQIECAAGSGDQRPMRMQTLRDFLLLMNRFSGKYGNDPKAQKVNWRVADMPYMVLKSIAPTREEWSQPGGAYSFFGRGGFVIDEAIARGDYSLYKYRQTDYYNNQVEAGGGWPITSCAAWARDTASVYDGTTYGALYGYNGGLPNSIADGAVKTPAGRPVCIAAAPVAGDSPNDRLLWLPYVDITRFPTFQLRLLPYRGDGQWIGDQIGGAIGNAINTVMRRICDNSTYTHKATQAAIAFAQLQGKTAQEAKAKAKTAADIANAAEQAAQYKAIATEIQLAVTAANLYCAGNPIPTEGLPPIDLPAMEPPATNPKFGVEEMMDSIRYAGPLSLSPDTITNGRKAWNAAVLALMGLGGAGLGALAYKKRKR